MKKILIIEEDSSFADSLKAKLGGVHKVELCQDGQSGYYAIYEFKPDLVLLSLTIAQMDPVSLLGKIRAQKQFQKLPIFVLANSATLGRSDDALAAGAHEAFSKEEDDAAQVIRDAISTFLTPALARRSLSQKPMLTAVSIGHRATVGARNAVAEAVAVQAGASVAATVPVQWLNNQERFAPGILPPPETDMAYRKSGRPHLEYLGDVRTAENVPVRQIHEFLDGYGQQAHAVRQEFIRYRTADASERVKQLHVLLEHVSRFNAGASEAGLQGLGRYLSVIEARVRQLAGSSSPATPNSLLSLATALDALAALNNHVEELEPLNNLHPLALVVDDDTGCRKTLSLGLEKSKIKTTGVDNPDAALLEAESKPFDLIFLDVDLPKMNGFALCARIRIIPTHRKTPILFVTSLNDIKSRASSRVSGGNDFISKPINLYELGINAWTLIINRRVLQSGTLTRV